MSKNENQPALRIDMS